MSNLEEWCTILESWLPICEEPADDEKVGEYLRALVSHFRTAPSDVIALIGAVPSASESDALIDIRAHVSLAARLVGSSPVGMMLSRNSEGRILCSIGHPETGEESTVEGYSEALVRVAAMGKFLVTLINGIAPSNEQKRAAH